MLEVLVKSAEGWSIAGLHFMFLAWVGSLAAR
jgi:hypothetical protein